MRKISWNICFSQLIHSQITVDSDFRQVGGFLRQ
jgi:hypothetical protein